MSYRIEYNRHIDKYEVVPMYSKRFPILLGGAFGLFLLGTMLFWAQGAELLRSVLIPGEDAVTVAAFRTMRDDLRSGAGLRDAVYAFCSYVLHGA